MRCWLWALLLLLAGCVRSWDLPLPDEAQLSGRAIIVVITQEQRPVVAYASPLPATIALPGATARGALEAFVLSFECELSDLELSMGPLNLLVDASATGRPLPEPSKILHSTLDGEEQTRWEELSGVAPPSLADIRIPSISDSNCSDFSGWNYRIRSRNTSSPMSISLAVDMRDGSMLVSPRRSVSELVDFYSVSRSGTATVATLGFDMVNNAAYLAADARLWVLGRDGETLVGRFESGFVSLHTNGAPGQYYAWMAGSEPQEEGELELFSLSDHRNLRHFEGQRGTWRELVDEPLSDSVGRYAGLVRLSRGKAAAVGVVAQAVTWYDKGALWHEMLELGADEQLTAIAYVPKIGVVVGSSRGRLLAERGDGWMVIGREGADGVVDGLVRFRAGFVVARGVTLQQIFADGGACPVQTVAPEEIQKVISVGRDLGLVSRADGEDPWVSIVEGRGGYPSCPGRDTILEWGADPSE